MIFYSPEIHSSLFKLPRYMRESIEKGGIISDDNPKI